MVTPDMRGASGRPRDGGAPDDLRVDGDVVPTVRSRLRRPPSVARIAARAALGATALAAVAVVLLPPARTMRGAAAAPAFLATRASPATWLPISHPRQLYAVAGLPLAHPSPDYEARRTADGSARLDRLTYGAFGDPAPFLSLAIRRSGARTIIVPREQGADAPVAPDAGETPAAPDILVDLVRVAATGGLAVTHAGRAEDMPTRFGPFSVVPLTLRRAAVARPCLGFRLVRPAPVAIAGFACGGETLAPDPAAVACLLDGIELADDGEDGAVRRFFAQSGPHRDRICASLLPMRSASR